MLKKLRIWVGAGALLLLPGLVLAAPTPDRDDFQNGRRAQRATRRAPVRTAIEEHQCRPEPVRRVARRRHAVRHRRPVVQQRCTCVTRVIAGHYETRYETIRTPGHYETVRTSGPRIRFGRHVEVGLSGGCTERVWVEGTVRRVPRKVWVPARRVILEKCRRCAPRKSHRYAPRH